ncbi:hypothetical protein GCM10010404_75650 [Nonomuraea africana]|uniref:Uncharacterized protein n=1 Tax=Nonomuraea africana TaxID=46171 RepID=A0ABR9KD88_9ACTN|nr:hypothetical protein [Nonomuraea africana]MBE1559974.1 hypothetical protein [Nonomuraea africana]
MARTLDEDELIEHWLLIGKEPDLLTGRLRDCYGHPVREKDTGQAARWRPQDGEKT